MSRPSRSTTKYRRKGKNLISSNQIKPENWHISESEAKEALQAKGYNVKQIKKIHGLKHQVSISYWDNQGNICSSFFSYRIFARWHKEVEKLIDNCQNLKLWARLNHIMGYEFAYYHYLSEIEDTLQQALGNRLDVLQETSTQAVFQVV
ncbi:hypothetical protein [Anabaena lutea]|uniref:Uncharacterized protein n=1 Tax=Anabaena lutea FACHB-196 TaxID=2692881 RepID=A0ABR8FHC7_9NOST|nr:hypothetical protein [Anabaena lutea]MBD2569189.1 hypothetical protein [Anabaena lutea FACHB-196]